MSPSLSQLPPDVLRYIPNVSRMDISDTLAFSQIDRTIRKVCQGTEFWHALALRDLTTHPERLTNITNQQIRRDLGLIHQSVREDARIPELCKAEVPLGYYYGWRGYDRLQPDKDRKEAYQEFLEGAVRGGHWDLVEDFLTSYGGHITSSKTQPDADIKPRSSSAPRKLITVKKITRDHDAKIFAALFEEAILTEQKDLLLRFIDFARKNSVIWKKFWLGRYLSDAVQTGNLEIFDIINNLPNTTDANRRDAFLAIIPAQNEKYNYPFVTHPIIIETLWLYSSSALPNHSEMLECIFYSKYDDGIASILRRILTEYPVDIPSFLEIGFADSVLNDDRQRYLQVALEYATPGQIREGFADIYSPKMFDLITSYMKSKNLLRTDDIDALLWHRHGEEITKHIIPLASKEGVLDAFIRSIAADVDHEGSMPSPATVKHLQILLSYLSEEHYGMAERFMRRQYGMTLKELREKTYNVKAHKDPEEDPEEDDAEAVDEDDYEADE